MRPRQIVRRIRALPANELVGGALLLSMWISWLASGFGVLAARQQNIGLPLESTGGSGPFLPQSIFGSGSRFSAWTYLKSFLGSLTSSSIVLLIISGLLVLSESVKFRRPVLVSALLIWAVATPCALLAAIQNNASVIVSQTTKVAANALMVFAVFVVMRKRRWPSPPDAVEETALAFG